jgi:hypothetical protein
MDQAQAGVLGTWLCRVSPIHQEHCVPAEGEEEKKQGRRQQGQCSGAPVYDLPVAIPSHRRVTLPGHI